MSNKVFNGISCSGILGDVEAHREWIIFVWEIESETKIPMKHTFVSDLNELDKVTKALKDTEYVVVLQDKNNNYIPIKYSNEDLKIAIETDEEYWDRVGMEYLEEVYTKEELECVNI